MLLQVLTGMKAMLVLVLWLKTLGKKRGREKGSGGTRQKGSKLGRRSCKCFLFLGICYREENDPTKIERNNHIRTSWNSTWQCTSPLVQSDLNPIQSTPLFIKAEHEWRKNATQVKLLLHSSGTMSTSQNQHYMKRINMVMLEVHICIVLISWPITFKKSTSSFDSPATPKVSHWHHFIGEEMETRQN